MRTYTREEAERLSQDEDKFWKDEFKFLEIPPEHIKDFLETPIEVEIFSKINLDDLDNVVAYTKDLTADKLDSMLNLNGETILSLACSQSNNPEVIRYLIDKGCHLSHTNYYYMDCSAHLLNNKRLPNEDAVNFAIMYEWEKEELQMQQIINNGNDNKGNYDE